MRKIVNYKLVNGTVPEFIENGGYFPNESGFMIGITKDYDSRYTPEGTIWLKESDIEEVIDTIPVSEEFPAITVEAFIAQFDEFSFAPVVSDSEFLAATADALAALLEG